ncbi:MAG TPA: tetratricopeptide repeat protein [Terriglobales bacterium]|nr:tetratricopeptide repeat protein [Terriglobales bacterium]
MRIFLVTFCCAMALSFGTAVAQDDDSSSQASQDKAADAARAAEESSSRDTRIDLSPPKDDAKNHPLSGTKIDDDEPASDVQEMHPWNPHKAAKDVEVGDFYFKRKNYKAAIERYKDALIYKPNDAIAQFRLAESLDKTGNSGEAVEHYQEYLKILPHGPYSEDAQKALARLSADQVKASSSPK